MVACARIGPPRTFVTDPATAAARVVGIAIAVLGIIALVARFPFLPAVVPTHFDFAGQPDGWGPSWTVLGLAGIWAALGALLAWVSRRPEWFNFPVPVTEDSAQYLYREGERMIVWMLLAIDLVFVAITLTYYGLPSSSLILIAGLAVLVIAVVGVARMLRQPKPAP